MLLLLVVLLYFNVIGVEGDDGMPCAFAMHIFALKWQLT